MADEAPTAFHFLYRSDKGTIDRARWSAAAAPLAAIFVVTTFFVSVALPYSNRPLTERALFDPATFAANAYIIVYAFLLLLLAICWVNLGAKRFRDRGRPAPLGLAGLLPLAALVAGAAAWLQPRVAEDMPRWTVWGCDAIVIVIALWTIAELFDLTPKANSR
ncbi:MAG: hypothetical protein KGM42_17700 [Hyphomicrobiales bacterium]|nr:hypothetical protein [Hyphomicrobiales bacterium]